MNCVHPDLTEMVDWVLKTNDFLTYLDSGIWFMCENYMFALVSNTFLDSFCDVYL